MRREFFPLFCQFFQIFVYIILNLAIGQLVGFGEDDREGYSRRTPCKTRRIL